MNKYLHIIILLVLVSCGQTNQKSDKKENASASTYKLTDKKVKFLWRDNKYDEALKDTVSSIFINEEFCKTITDPERAALAYVATFIGNECWWEGEGKEDRSNLKCKILTALNLGYQCSDKHLGFLRQWFKDDKKSLKELENCPTTPYTATIQDTFEEIILTVKGNKISISFEANGVNVREGESWSWTETDHFQLYKDNIRLVKKDESKVKHENFDNGE